MTAGGTLVPVTPPVPRHPGAPKWFGQVNYGRAEHVGLVRESMTLTAAHLSQLDGGFVLSCDEVDEGDKTHPRDHVLLAETMRDHAALWCMDTREPFVASPHLEPAGVPEVHHAGPGVDSWSPARSLQVARWPRRDGATAVTTIGGHYYAGASGHQHPGNRPRAAVQQLTEHYDAMLDLHRTLIRDALHRGDDVVWAMDVNSHAFPKLHPREVEVVHDGPDHVRAIASDGRRVKVGAVRRVPMTIEPKLHALHLAQITFPKA